MEICDELEALKRAKNEMNSNLAKSLVAFTAKV
jgi:hypothetical protein